MNLDTVTIIVVSAFVDVALLFILIHTWRTRTTYPGFMVWIAATACWSFGGIFNLVFYNLHPQFIPKIIGITLIMMHPLLQYEGLIRFHGIRGRWWMAPVNISLVLAGLVNQAYFLYVVDNVAARIVGSSMVIAVLFVRAALEPLFYAKIRRYSIQWLLALYLLPLIAMLFARIRTYISVPPDVPVSAIIAQDFQLRWLVFYGIIVQLVIAYSYLSLTSDRVEEELRQSEESYRDLTFSLQERVEEETRRRLEQERMLATQSRLAAMGEMISAIAHQWRQPLATLGMIVQRTHAVGAMQGLTPAYLDEFKANAMRQVRYMSDTIEEFRGFYRPEKQKESFSPFTCISDPVKIFEPQLTGNGIVVSVNCRDCDAKLPVNGFPNEFKQVVLNLLGNARDAILESRAVTGEPEKGCIIVQLSTNHHQTMTIDISDNGRGIPADIAPRIFDPYFTTKEESGGTGIGLFMSRMIVEDSLGGRLRLLKGEAGATFRIELPLEEKR